MNLDGIKFDIKIIDNFFKHKVFETNKIDKEYNNIREIIINGKRKLKDITFNKYVNIKIFFITKIVHKYLSRCIRLSFKKYTINLRVIILKLHAYINY